MNLKLTRNKSSLYGVFGDLRDESGKIIAVTLEHAYLDGAVYAPKLAAGTYTVLRHPPRRLPYETFEVQNVPDFQGNRVDGILIHRGNFNNDSEGCILLGHDIGPACILESGVAFQEFMDLQKDLNSFTLTVT